MANRKAEFTQADVTRAIKGAAQAGRPAQRVKLPGGIELILSEVKIENLDGNEWDEVLNGFETEKRTS
ncbi:MAG: hypothetical protein MRY72_08330 [Aquisalinus sp.]|nr:hypothetical protein [Aquisalinus sp.]